jgi:magnesium-transporting ATPase (P-type)
MFWKLFQQKKNDHLVQNKSKKKLFSTFFPKDALTKMISRLPFKKNKDQVPKKKKKKSKPFRSVLQIKLGKLALQIGYGGIIAALIAFLLLVLRMSIEEFAIKKNAWSNIYIKFIISYLIQGITVIVVAVPEGLPLAVTLALAYAVRVIHFCLIVL